MKRQIGVDVLLISLHMYRCDSTRCSAAGWNQKQLKCFPVSEEL